MSDYDYNTWEEYVRGKFAELKKTNPAQDEDEIRQFLPVACIQKRIWLENKRHHDFVMEALSEELDPEEPKIPF